MTEFDIKKRNFGFTLMELLVVMAIVGILASISVFAAIGSRESARDARRKADLESIRSALEIYFADCGTYPPSISSGTQLVGNGTSCPASNIYMEEVPDDPINDRDYDYIPLSSNTRYLICAGLEEVTAADATCSSNSANCGSATCSYSVTSN